MRSSLTKNMVFLGVDTSNYRTSVAAVDGEGEILANERILLSVPQGKRGLRQSDALFQHVMNLPDLTQRLFAALGERRKDVVAVTASTRPRPVEGSYMPVFNAGIGVGRTLADAFGVPYFETSHQEGHIEAVRFGSPLESVPQFFSFHFSGGTTEAVLVTDHPTGSTYEIVGGSKDISYGQLLDRIGVALGMEFPSGEQMDQIALKGSEYTLKVPKISVKDGYMNLSGVESHCQRVLAQGQKDIPDEKLGDALIVAIFQEIGHSMGQMMKQLADKYGVNDFLFAGGVSSSQYLRSCISQEHHVVFGDAALSSDNAVGVARLGRKYYGA